MEIPLRKVRKNFSKRCGNIASSNVIAQSSESLVLFQNNGYLEISGYYLREVDNVFINDEIYSVSGHVTHT